MTPTSSEKCIAFLDLLFALSESKLKIVYKLKWRVALLHYSFFNPEHANHLFVSGQMLRKSELCFAEKDFEDYSSQIGSWFLKIIFRKTYWEGNGKG